MFYDTSIFEIHYTAQPNTYRPPYTYTSWSTTTTTPYGQQPPSPRPEPAGNPLMAITPELLARVTRAGASNPTLAHLLQLAASGYATQEQLRTLGLLIQSLAASPEETYPSPSSHASASSNTTRPSNYAYQPQTMNTKQPDLVLEFQEKPSVQFLFPRGAVTYERISSTTHLSRHDVLLTTSLPFEPSPLGSSEPSLNNQLTGSRIVTFRFANVPTPLWDFIEIWVGGPSMVQANERTLENKVHTHRAFRKQTLISCEAQLPTSSEVSSTQTSRRSPSEPNA